MASTGRFGHEALSELWRTRRRGIDQIGVSIACILFVIDAFVIQDIVINVAFG